MSFENSTPNLYQVILGSIGDAVIATDNHGNVTFLNHVAEDLTGWPTAEAAGRPLTEVFRIVNESSRQSVANPALRALAEGRVVGLANHTVLIARDGLTEYPIDDSAAPIQDAGGNVAGAVLVFRDITERKKAERDLRESERQLREFADTAPAMLWDTDADGSCTFLSREWYATTGQTEAAALGIGWTDATHPDDKARAADAFLSASRHRADFRCEYRLRQRDGSYRWALDVGRPRFGPSGAFRGMVGVVVDIHDRKVAEERFAFVRRSSGVGFWYCDLPFDVLEWDEQVKAHFHLPPDARVTIDTFYDRIHPDDRGPTRAAIERSIAEHMPYDVDYRTVDPDTGAVNTVRAIGRTDYAADGTPVHFDGVTLDVTEQRRAVEALSWSEQRHRALVTATADVAYRMSADWKELLPLDGRDLIASSAEPMRGWMQKNIPAFEHARFREAIRRAVATRQTFELEHQVIRSDGTTGWTFSRAVPIVDGTGANVAEWFGTASDITARKAAEAEVARVTAESERRRRLYEAILAATPDFVYIFNLEGRVLYANEALVAMWGAGDPVGKTFLEIGYEPWHAEMHCREIAEVCKSKRPLRGEVPFNGTQGRRTYDYIFVPVFGADGEVEAVAGTTRDITDRKEHENALKEQDRRKDEFLATLAHELRNPLAPIRTGIQVLRARPTESEAADILAMMDRQAGHLAHLVDDLMDVARVTSGKIKLRRAALDLRAVVTNAVEATRPVVQAASHALATSLPGAPLPVDGDATRLVQVLTNLITNAAKYTEPGGRITVAAEADGGEAVVRVSDSGIGIPPEALPTVFDMFAQAGAALHRSQGGIGIGLTLVKRLVEMHGGSVTAESPGADQGSTFTVRLPVVSAASGLVEDATRLAVAGAAQPLRVLVVDDNTDGAASLALLLRLGGHASCTAHSGLEGIEAAKEFRPDIIFLDIGLPGMSGHEVAAQLRRDRAFDRTKIVALTGWGSEEDRRKSREAGCDEHLTKPVDADEVKAVLAGVRR